MPSICVIFNEFNYLLRRNAAVSQAKKVSSEVDLPGQMSGRRTENPPLPLSMIQLTEQFQTQQVQSPDGQLQNEFGG